MKSKHHRSFYEFILKVQAISKIGLNYSKDAYALENYLELSDLSTNMLKEFTQVDFKRPHYFARDLYPTPNVSVRMIIFNEKEEVLLVKEKVDGGYTLPGGWADVFESPVEAIKKECIQEAGADVIILALTGVYYFDFYHRGQPESQYALVFKGKLKGPLQPFGHEITDVQFFPITQLPKSISHKLARKDLLKMLQDAKKGDVYFE